MDFHHSERAPAAIGPYSQAVSVGGFLYTSGQVALDAETGELVGDDFESQARKVLSNLEAVLTAAGCRFTDVVKATVYLTDLSLFPRVNAIYAEAFSVDPAPARVTVGVSALPLGAQVEIDAIALVR